MLNYPVMLIACHGDVVLEDSVSVHLGDVVPSVATVAFSTSSPVTARIEYGPDDTYGHVTSASALGSDHEIDLIGLRIDATTHFRVIATDSDGDTVGTDHTVDIPDGPSCLPEVTGSGTAPGWILTAFNRVDEDPCGGALIFDDSGAIVWYVVEEQFSFTADLTPDGRTVALLVANPHDLSDAHIVWVALDGRTVEDTPVPDAHHAMIQPAIPGVRFAYIAAVHQTWEGETVIGDRVVEVGEDGSEREVWNAFDHIAVQRRPDWEAGFYADGADWTHANGLDYDPARDAYFLSMFNLSAVVKIDRASGDTVWTLGGAASDFAFDDDDGFDHQHAPEIHGDDLYLFDNGVEGRPSRAIQYSLDVQRRTARNVWQWETPESATAGILGDVDVLADDSVLSAWGDAGEIDVADRAGEPLRRVEAEPGTILPRAQMFSTLYP